MVTVLSDHVSNPASLPLTSHCGPEGSMLNLSEHCTKVTIEMGVWIQRL